LSYEQLCQRMIDLALKRKTGADKPGKQRRTTAVLAAIC
jgi:hypothetical protein